MSSKVSALTALAGANVAADDNLYIVDTSVATSKRITWAEFLLGSRASASFTGTLTSAGALVFSTDIAYPGAGVQGVWRQAVAGLVLQGQGSTYDMVLLNAGGGIAAAIPTTTRNIITPLGNSADFGVTVAKATVNTTAVGNVTTGEDDLMTYSLPLNAFSSATKGIHIKAWGRTANNVNAKTLKAYFGSQLMLTNALVASIAGVWIFEADVWATGTDTQDYIADLRTTGAAAVAVIDPEVGTATQDDGAAIIVKLTGEATATDDIIQEGMRITFYN